LPFDFCYLPFALFFSEAPEKKGKGQKSKGKRQKWLSESAFWLRPQGRAAPGTDT
jgi:hypothetical protein